MTDTAGHRVAIVSDASGYVGPDLSRLLATCDHDLVIGDPAPGVVDQLAALGAAVEVVEGVRDLAAPPPRAASSPPPAAGSGESTRPRRPPAASSPAAS